MMRLPAISPLCRQLMIGALVCAMVGARSTEKTPYEVVEGAIRGTNVLDTPNSFLATNEAYSDFVLEFESRSIGDANSGVQFRTKPLPTVVGRIMLFEILKYDLVRNLPASCRKVSSTPKSPAPVFFT